jgi:RimJ/RimL family protein N-acetyltransferase
MKPDIFLRPLALEDAETSFHWRNDPEIWKYTKFNLSGQITLEMEQEWLLATLKQQDQKRYAICLKDTGAYIGNIQLLEVDGEKAVFHLFIGETSCWGKGIGKEATRLLLDYAFYDLGLQRVDLEVNKDNIAAIRIYTSWGFTTVGHASSFNRMSISKTTYTRQHLNQIL